MTNPVLRYRSDEPWYRAWVQRWQAAAPDDCRVVFQPMDEAQAAEAGRRAFVFLEPEPEDQDQDAPPPDGFLPNPESHGAEALARMRRHLGRSRWLKVWLRVPGGPTLLRAHHAAVFGLPRIWGELSVAVPRA